MLAVSNLMSNRVLPDALYVPWNLAMAAALGGLAWWAGLRPPELGWQRWARGARFGLVLAVLTLAVYLLALAMPAASKAFEDQRVDGGVGSLLLNTLVKIPLGTVLLEEIAFRSVLPALAARRWGIVRGSVFASVLFGFWHVLPSMNITNVNPVLADLFGDGPFAGLLGVVFAVAGTTLAGLWFCWLRYWSGSVLAPMIGHFSTNSLGYLFGWIVVSS